MVELEVNLIEIESVINARPLSYIGEGADDSLPITPNQSTSQDLVEMDKDRREYVSDVCARFISDYLMQLDNF